MVIKKQDSLRIKKLRKEARHISIEEGIFAAAKTSFGDRYVAPFAIALNASNSLVALLSSITGLLGPLTQIFSSRLIEKHSRKKIILRAVLFESLMWIPLVLLSILFAKGIHVGLLPMILLLSFSVYTIFLNITTPAWFSWLGDIVEEKRRGRWFSKRNLLIGFTTVVVAVSSAFFLDYFEKQGWAMLGFGILFSLAFLSRLMSWRSFRQQYEPKIKLRKGYYFSFWNFLKEAPKNNFGKFAIFRGTMSLATYISSPLLVVYLLRNLEFSYSIYMIITFAGTLVSLFFLELWGKFSDKYGNYKTLCITTIVIPTIPILWILSPSVIYLIFAPSIIGGVFWAGFNLSAVNFIYDNVGAQKRSIAVSYSNMLNGMGIFLGAGISALLIKFLTVTVIEPIILIFLIGGVARMLVVFFWIPKLKEIKQTKKFNRSKALKNIILKEAKPTILEEVHEIISIKKYFERK